MSGKVTLIGAGPGDEGLITVKAKTLLSHGDVIVYDRLVGDGILAMMPKSAEKIDVGKASANHKMSQDKINELLLNKALEGKNVIRLKGGDPFLFGRGGEELALLAENNIDFEVVPGVTSALSVPSYAGIPVTHRDFVSSVHIITAHAKAGAELNINFKACSEIGGTLVFLMGVANIKLITEGLINAGMDKNMPCAVIEKGTTPQQKKYLGTLSNISEKSKEAKSPAIIIVGRVCELSEKYDWFSQKPLSHKTVIVTRQKNRTSTLAAKLRAEGATVIECPSIKTEAIKDCEKTLVSTISEYNIIVFTSPTGVKITMDILFANALDARAFANAKIAAVGNGTANELKKYGICADIVPKTYNGAALGELLSNNANNNDKLLLLRAEISGTDLNKIIEEAGLFYKEIPIYKTIEECSCDLTDLINNSKVDYITFTSASMVRGFIKGHPFIDKSKIKAVCIGEMTAKEAEKNGFDFYISKEAAIDSIIEKIKELK